MRNLLEMGMIKTLFNIHSAVFFRPDKFYCSIDVGGGLTYKIWERPGKWMTDEKMDRLINDIQTIVAIGQDKEDVPDYGVLKGDKEDLKNRVITIAYEKKSGRPVGFAAQVFLDVNFGVNIINVLHLGLVYVAKDYQKKSMLGLLYILPNIILLLKRGFRPLWISSVSQVPSIVGVVGDFYEDVYPNPLNSNAKQSLMHKSLSLGIVKDHSLAFGTGEDAFLEIENQIICNSYTGGSDNLKKTFEDSPKYRDNKVNDFCNKFLDYDRGDDFLQIGRLSVKMIHNFFLKRVSGVSPVQWSLYLIVAGIFSISLPVLQWITRKPD